jgi:hypothetical protein
MPQLMKALTAAVAQLLLHECGLQTLHPASWQRYRTALSTFLEMVDEHKAP